MQLSTRWPQKEFAGFQSTCLLCFDLIQIHQLCTQQKPISLTPQPTCNLYVIIYSQSLLDLLIYKGNSTPCAGAYRGKVTATLQPTRARPSGSSARTAATCWSCTDATHVSAGRPTFCQSAGTVTCSSNQFTDITYRYNIEREIYIYIYHIFTCACVSVCVCCLCLCLCLSLPVSLCIFSEVNPCLRHPRCITNRRRWDSSRSIVETHAHLLHISLLASQHKVPSSVTGSHSVRYLHHFTCQSHSVPFILETCNLPCPLLVITLPRYQAERPRLPVRFI